MTGRKVGLPEIALAVLAVIGIIAYHWKDMTTVSNQKQGTASEDQSAGSGTALTVGPIQWDREITGDPDVPGAKFITGTVTNTSDRQFRYVQVEINLYDREGNQIDSTMANVSNLEGHGTWKFRAYVLNDDATSAKLKSVNGY